MGIRDGKCIPFPLIMVQAGGAFRYSDNCWKKSVTLKLESVLVADSFGDCCLGWLVSAFYSTDCVVIVNEGG